MKRCVSRQSNGASATLPHMRHASGHKPHRSRATQGSSTPSRLIKLSTNYLPTVKALEPTVIKVFGVLRHEKALLSLI